MDIEEGPFTPAQIRDGDRYELDHGHPLYCAPGDGDTSTATLLGGLVLSTDPDAREAGVDPGYDLGDKTLRAPDVAVGNVPDRPGWVSGVPPLAVEYAGRGQDEAELQHKIVQFFDAGTRWIWVVRLLGVRRVEVYEKGKPVRTAGVGDELVAPGVLRNAVKVEALFDRGAAREAALNNLLQGRGYESLDAVREEGREEGRDEGRAEGRDEGRAEGHLEAMRAAVARVARKRGLHTQALDQALAACTDPATLERWLDESLTAEPGWLPA